MVKEPQQKNYSTARVGGVFNIEKFIKEFHNDLRILKKYYNSLVTEYDGTLPVISPPMVDEWICEASSWAAQGEKVVEIGCGDGRFAEAVLNSEDFKTREYYLVDLANLVLKSAEKKIKKTTAHLNPWNRPRIITARCPVEKLDSYIEPSSADVVVAINVLMDTHLKESLNQIFKVLKPGGLLRATFTSKEAYDVFWRDHIGLTYFTWGDWGVWLTPLEFYRGTKLPAYSIDLKNRKKIEFVRIQRCATAHKWRDLLQGVGFNVAEPGSSTFEKVNYPLAQVKDRWNLTEFQESAIKKRWNGYFPEVWDIIAQKPFK